jgi:hypothetical protein
VSRESGGPSACSCTARSLTLLRCCSKIGAPSTPTISYNSSDADGGLLLNVVNYLQDFIIRQTNTSHWRTLAARCNELSGR